MAVSSPCPYCSETHPPSAFVCPTTEKRLAGLVAPGTVIDGKYRIDGVLGTGGMAAVYRAEHLKITRTVALKLLLPEFVADPQLVGRVEREARAAGGIDHRNVAAVTDLGMSPEFGPYLAMELLKGEDLAATLHRRGGRLPAVEAAGVMRQVLAALEAAHAQGVVHRDLKPENVFMVATPGGGTMVKVLDFGISKVAGGQGAVSSLTTVGTIMGTPQYMAPEQAAGAREQDARVDTYAAGVLLYELLTGEHPHDAENYNLLINRLLNQPAVPILEHDPSLDPGLAAIVMRAVERRPEDRFQTAREMLEAVRDWSRSAGEADLSSPALAVTLWAGDPAQRRAPTSSVEAEKRPPAATNSAEAEARLRAPTLDAADAEPRAPRRRGRAVVASLALALAVALAGGAYAVRALRPALWNAGVTRAGLAKLATTEGVTTAPGATRVTGGGEQRRAPTPTGQHGGEPAPTSPTPGAGEVREREPRGTAERRPAPARRARRARRGRRR